MTTTSHFVRTVSMIAIAALIFAGLVGCRTVNTRHIVGERIAEDLSDQVNGVWKAGDTVIQIRQSEPGEIRIAHVEWDDDDGRFTLNEVTFIISRLDDDYYLNSRSEVAPEDETWYQFSRVRLSEDTILIWGVTWDSFEHAVKADLLKGRIVSDRPDDATALVHLWIDADKEALDAFLRERSLADLFEVKTPGVLVRLTNK